VFRHTKKREREDAFSRPDTKRDRERKRKREREREREKRLSLHKKRGFREKGKAAGTISSKIGSRFAARFGR
jgi:hypothetical protein